MLTRQCADQLAWKSTLPKRSVMQWLHSQGFSCLCAVCSTKPGAKGSPLLYYARVVHIVGGVLVVLAVELVLPWCVTPAQSPDLPLHQKGIADQQPLQYCKSSSYIYIYVYVYV
jgi:hypothetical protein